MTTIILGIVLMLPALYVAFQDFRGQNDSSKHR